MRGRTIMQCVSHFQQKLRIYRCVVWVLNQHNFIRKCGGQDVNTLNSEFVGLGSSLAVTSFPQTRSNFAPLFLLSRRLNDCLTTFCWELSMQSGCQHHLQGGVEIILFSPSCHRNQDKLWPCGPHGPCVLSKFSQGLYFG